MNERTKAEGLNAFVCREILQVKTFEIESIFWPNFCRNRITRLFESDRGKLFQKEYVRGNIELYG